MDQEFRVIAPGPLKTAEKYHAPSWMEASEASRLVFFLGGPPKGKCSKLRSASFCAFRGSCAANSSIRWDSHSF